MESLEDELSQRNRLNHKNKGCRDIADIVYEVVTIITWVGLNGLGIWAGFYASNEWDPAAATVATTFGLFPSMAVGYIAAKIVDRHY